jgi:ATP-binding cassette subfamily B (MDR/TAP) protein 1
LNIKIKNCHVAGIFFGYSLASRMIFTGVIFSLGVVVIQKWHYGQENVYLAINVLMSAVMGVGMATSNVPSVSKAKSSAQTIFAIIDEKSTLDVRDGQNATI